MKKITVLGIGKLGLCFSLLLENNGYDVLGVDINKDYINSINNKTLSSSEPSVNVLLSKSKNLRATMSFIDGANFSDILFVFVATPSLEDNSYDHSQIENIVSQIVENNIRDKILVINCTVMPGYCDTLAKRLSHLNIKVVYNPEFIAQGDIIYGLENPDFVLIGSNDFESGNKIEHIYWRIVRGCIFKKMNLISAELTKLALNCFITTKISFANSIGDLAKKSGASARDVLEAIGTDTRVGHKCLKYGYGFGGPCFPRDNKALLKYAQDKGVDLPISKASILSNEIHHSFLLEEKISKSKTNKEPVVFESLSYKPNSSILIESQQLRLCSDLIDAGIEVIIKESRPEVLNNLPQKIKDKII